jgi:hypothetical protein
MPVAHFCLRVLIGFHMQPWAGCRCIQMWNTADWCGEFVCGRAQGCSRLCAPLLGNILVSSLPNLIPSFPFSLFPENLIHNTNYHFIGYHIIIKCHEQSSRQTWFNMFSYCDSHSKSSIRYESLIVEHLVSISCCSSRSIEGNLHLLYCLCSSDGPPISMC